MQVATSSLLLRDLIGDEPASFSLYPTADPRVRHVVDAHDTWPGIALRYGVAASSIKQANNLFGDVLVPGTSLVIPSASPPPAAAQAAPPASQYAPYSSYPQQPGFVDQQFYSYLYLQQQQQQQQDAAQFCYPAAASSAVAPSPSSSSSFDPFGLYTTTSEPAVATTSSPTSPSTGRRAVSSSPLYMAHTHSALSTPTASSNNRPTLKSVKPPASLVAAPQSGRHGCASAPAVYSGSAKKSAVDVSRYHRHTVSHEDTLQGVALRYDVSPADIKRLNRMFTDEVYAFSTLIVPVDRDVAARLPPPKDVDPERTLRFQMAAFRKRTSTTESEANYYVKLADGDFKEALRLWQKDQEWETEHIGPEDPLPAALRKSSLVAIPSPNFASRRSHRS